MIELKLSYMLFLKVQTKRLENVSQHTVYGQPTTQCSSTLQSLMFSVINLPY